MESLHSTQKHTKSKTKTEFGSKSTLFRIRRVQDRRGNRNLGSGDRSLSPFLAVSQNIGKLIFGNFDRIRILSEFRLDYLIFVRILTEFR